jgi:TonB family protein
MHNTIVARATVLLLLTTLAHAQTPPTESIEVFNGPKTKVMEPPAYPFSERAMGRDGWVNLNFMIDPRGKPYEIMVTDSTGNKVLEKAAIKAAEDWEFEPATLAGVPIDASYTAKVQFILSGEAGANNEFVSAFKAFQRAAKAADKEKADAALAKMKVKNLYEDAYYNLALYEHARRWGTEAQQLAAIQRAIAEERNANYLPKAAFAVGLETLLNLQIRRRDFAGALDTWNKLQPQADAATLARWEAPIAKIKALRNDTTPYAIAGDFGDSTSWYFRLFRRTFHVAVTSGRVAEIKLRCDKRYVFFKHDPEMQYTVADKYGRCNMELIGDPGTKFDLVQS